jgi:translation initiation factor 1
MNNDDYEIVWSDDGSHLDKNKKQSKLAEIIPTQVKIRIRLEKKARGGKQVSVVYDLPENPPYFQKLLKEFKRALGVGGVLKNNTLEFQGDQVEKLKILFEQKGFKL